jgi:hypothetical protein
MSKKATLYINNYGFNVPKCRFEVSKPTDYIGNPTGEPSQNSINTRIEASTDRALLEWAESDRLVKSGHIFFMLNPELNRHKTLYFMDAHCISHSVISPQEDGRPALIELMLSPREMGMHIPENYTEFWTPEDEQERMN